MKKFKKTQSETTTNSVLATANTAEISECTEEKLVSQNEDDFILEEWPDPVIDTDTYYEDEDEDDAYPETYEDFLARYNTIKVGPYEMQSHFSEDALRPDNDDFDALSYYEKRYKIDSPESFERDQMKYNELVGKLYPHIAQAEALDNDTANPLQFELSSSNDELYWIGITRRFKATVYNFDRSTKPFCVQRSYLPKRKNEMIKYHIKDLVRSEQASINHSSMEGSFNGKLINNWAVHLIVYTRTINDTNEEFNYYEVYTKHWVYSILCKKADLDKALNSITELEFSKSLVKNMIMTSQNHIKIEYASRNFSNVWFRNINPVPVHTALTEAEEQILMNISEPKKKFILSIVGYAALATIIPELSELPDVPKILAPVIDAKLYETEAVTELIKCCFAYTGDGDIPEAYIFTFKKTDTVDIRGCERRIVTIDTSQRSKKLKDKDAFEIALSEYTGYIRERRRKIDYPYTWLTLGVGKQMWKHNEYLSLSCEGLTESEVSAVKPIICKLYRNALVGLGEDGNPQLLEHVTNYYREADTNRENKGYRGSYRERMKDLIDACCTYMLRDNLNIMNAEASKTDCVSASENETSTVVSSAPLKKTEMTDQLLNSINDMLVSNSPDILRDKPASAEQAKEVTFIYKTPKAFVLAVCNEMLSGLISGKGYASYTVDDFWSICTERGITQCSTGEAKFRVSIQGTKVGVTALQLEGNSDNCRLKLPTA